MRPTFIRRLTMMTFVLMLVGVLLLGRLASFQFQVDMATYYQNIGSQGYAEVRDRFPERGRIFDRNGEVLATNTTEYKIGLSPAYVSDARKLSKDLAEALGDSENRIYDLIVNSKTPEGEAQYVAITSQPVSTEVAQRVARLNSIAVKMDPEPKRIYPHNSLAAHVIGFMGWDGDIRRGYVGVEGAYNDELAGQSRVIEQSNIPFEANPNDQPTPGKDIYLTIDRNIQYLAETELLDAINTYGAVDGQVLIMDPRSGEILAMASFPTFDPNNYFTVDPSVTKNPIVSGAYEPGSVFKVVTASIALQSGKVSEDSTYYENSPFREVGGAKIYNWDRAAHGSQNFVDILVHSWNLGTTWLSVDVLKATDFYNGLRRFGVSTLTGIDLEGEVPGYMRTPDESALWSDSDLATNSFGQGLTVTPLQMLTFVNTIANGGQMMQPHVRLKSFDGERSIYAVPAIVRTPISADVARRMTKIMVQVVNGGPQAEGTKAQVRNYTVAGKTGTAQIACATCPEGYDPQLYNAWFAGFLPADEPRVSVLIKLDKVGNFASQTAAPAFAKLVKQLVVLMNIPTDAQRQQLQAQGGDTSLIVGR